MTAPNCGDSFDRDQELQGKLQEVDAAADRVERILRASDHPPALADDKSYVVKDQNGRPMLVTTSEGQRVFQEFAAGLSSRELDDLIVRGFSARAKPLGAEGRFSYYESFMKRPHPWRPSSGGGNSPAAMPSFAQTVVRSNQFCAAIWSDLGALDLVASITANFLGLA